MTTTWLVIANHTTAYLYHLEKHVPLFKDLPPQFREHPEPELIHTFKHPQGRLHDRALISDGEGHYGGGGSGAHGSYSPHTSHKDVEAQQFAHEIAAFLEKKHYDHAYDHLLICAEPHFYGILNKVFSHHIHNVVSDHLLKDYVPLAHGDLKRVIEQIANHFK